MKIKLTKPLELFLIAIAFLPWDSFRFIPFGTYKPISLIIIIIIPFIYATMKIIKNRSISKSTLMLIFIFLYGAAISVYNGILQKNLSGFKYFIIAFSIAIITYLTSEICFKEISLKFQDIDQYVELIMSYFTKLAWVLLVLGIIELMVIYGVLPAKIKVYFSELLLGHYRGDRIQLLSYEPSWAARNLAILLPMVFYRYKIKQNIKNKVLLIGIVILLITTFSFEGIAIVVFGTIMYLIIGSKDKLKNIFYIILVAIILFIALGLMLDFWEKVVGASYFTIRFREILNINDLRQLIVMDASTMIRILHPLLGIIMFLCNPILGVGGGNYNIFYSEYLNKYIIPKFPEFLNGGETLYAYQHGIGNCKNLYARYLGEFGIVGIILIAIFFALIFKGYRNVKMKNKKVINIIIIFTLSSVLQFDSYNYMNIWVMFAFVKSISQFQKKQFKYKKI